MSQPAKIEPLKAETSPAAPANSDKKPSEKKSVKRRLLMVVLPLTLVIVGGGYYLFSGRYVSTDNAYVKADKIMIAPEVTGKLIKVTTGDNQQVKRGDLLVEIDPQPFEIAVAKAQANVAAAAAKVEEIRSSYRQKLEEAKISQVDLNYQETELKRESSLLKDKATPIARVDEVRRDRDSANTKMAQLQQEVAVILAPLMGNPDLPTEEQPMYMQAVAELEKAKLDLSHTKIYAPADGVTGTMPTAGAYAPAGVPLLSLVSSEEVWIEANFKETELTHMVPGQKVDIEVDTYPDHTWKGTVESISPATGSEFSLLPAQNATGNWVKVIQRIAVRIKPEQNPDDPPLRTGMSALIDVDTQQYPHLPKAAADEMKRIHP